MASRGRTIPSVLGGGLAGGTRAILEAVMERERRESAETLENRRLDIAERTQALNQITTLAGFLEPGTLLGEAGPMVQRVFGRAFDIETEGLEDLELNPGTFATALDAKREELLNDPDFDQSLLLPSTRAALGLEPSEDVAASRDLQAQMQFSALTEILNDEELMSEHVERVLGRDPTSVRIPGFGDQPDRIVPFDTSTEAQIYAELLKHRENFGLKLRLDNKDRLTPLIEEIQDAVENSAIPASISTPSVMRVLGIYNDAVTAGDSAPIRNFLTNPNVTEGEKTALLFLTGSTERGDAAFLSSIDPRLSTFYRILTAVGSETDPEQTVQLMTSITRALRDQTGVEMFDPGFDNALPGGRSPFGGLQVEFFDSPEAPGAPEGTPPDGPGVSLGDFITDEDIRLAHESGDTRAELAAFVGIERVNQVLGDAEPSPTMEGDFPEGGMNPDAVPIPFRQDVQQLNNLLRRLEVTQGEIARRNIEQAIERIRERIRSGVSGG